MTDNDGFRVVPDALRRTQASFDDAAQRWSDFAQQSLPSWRLNESDLGLLGQEAGIIADYNAALDAITEKVKSGTAGFMAASDKLNTAAKAYEAQDERYYHQFGWINSGLDRVSPPPRSGIN